MSEELTLPFNPGFSIEPSYALLLGEAQIIYARFESTIVDIIGFHKKNYRTGYYCKDMLMPRDLLADLQTIGKTEDKEQLLNIREGFQKAVELRNALDHAVPCGSPDHYDVLHFPHGDELRGGRKPKTLNSYRGSVFDYGRLLEEAKQMALAYREASAFFYSLRDRTRAGETFPGEPC